MNNKVQNENFIVLFVLSAIFHEILKSLELAVVQGLKYCLHTYNFYSPTSTTNHCTKYCSFVENGLGNYSQPKLLFYFKLNAQNFYVRGSVAVTGPRFSG